MAQNPPAGTQRLVPMLAYDDAEAALRFLCEAFGFVERFRMPMDDGRIGHAEVVLHGQVVMLASVYPELGFASPRKLEGCASQLMFYVDDVDAHFARAREAGATVLAEPVDEFYGARVYRALDCEGHRWIFATQTRDVSADELAPKTKEA
jgi:PhnB protein